MAGNQLTDLSLLSQVAVEYSAMRNLGGWPVCFSYFLLGAHLPPHVGAGCARGARIRNAPLRVFASRRRERALGARGGKPSHRSLRHARCSVHIRASPVRSRHSSSLRSPSWLRPLGDRGGSLGCAYPSVPCTCLSISHAPQPTGATSGCVLGRGALPGASARRVVCRRAAPLPGDRCHGSHAVECSLPRSHEGPARAVANSRSPECMQARSVATGTARRTSRP